MNENKIFLLRLELNQQVDPVDPCSAFDGFKVTRKSPRNKGQNKIESFHNSDTYCSVCKISFQTIEQYNNHRSGHVNNLKCSLCTTVLKSYKNYDKHIAKCKPYKCTVCEKIIRFRPNFIKHMRTHKPKNTNEEHGLKVPKSERLKYKCSSCEKEFTSWEYFKVHQKIHSENLNLKCDICDKTFSALACLRGHYKVHNGEKPFK